MKGARHATSGEIIRFLFVGAATVALDFFVYRGLITLGIGIAFAKAAGFVSGTVFAYSANRTITFRATGGSLAIARFALVYSCGLALNVGTNAALLFVFGKGPLAIGSAFLAATAVSATSNFLTMRHFVFAQGDAAGSLR